MIQPTSILRAALAAFTLGCLALTSHAALLTYEGFSYTGGTDLDGLNGGTGWATSWDNQTSSGSYQVGTSGLSYGSLVTNGNQARHVSTFENTGRRLDIGFGGVWDTAGYVSDPFITTQIDQGTVWGSFLVRRDTATASWDGGPSISLHRNNTDWFSDGGSSSLALTWNPGSSIWTASVNGAGTTNLASTAVGDVALFVFKMELSLTAGANNIYVWLNPTGLGGADLLTSTADASFTGLNTDAARFKALSFYGGGSVSNATSLDEIRFGTTFADVTPVPEPSTYALVALGLGALWALRRRRA